MGHNRLRRLVVHVFLESLKEIQPPGEPMDRGKKAPSGVGGGAAAKKSPDDQAPGAWRKQKTGAEESARQEAPGGDRGQR